MSDLLINIFGLVLIAGIIWWFWISTPKGIKVNKAEVIDVIVDGGSYTPNTIQASVGESMVLNFIRKDPSPCAAKVVFEALELSADLAVGRPKKVSVSFKASGDYDFTCQMGMYRGTIHVE